MAPMVLPAIAFGLALPMPFSNAGIGLSRWTLVAGHMVICAPFVLRTTAAAAASIDPALVAFMMSFDHVPVSLFLGDARAEVLPIRLWYLIFHSLDVRAAAASGILIAVTFALISVMERITGVSRHFR